MFQHPTTATPLEKARRWDALMAMLAKPGLRDRHTRHLSSMRRATEMLLAYREELPTALTPELKAYRAMLNDLYLEAVDGFESIDGILNYFPASVVMTLAGELSQSDTTDDAPETG